jgi:hypothetical protein
VEETVKPESWGFYSHRLLNRMAVFTLPPELISFYKQHIEFISEHAIDPDKRRYAIREEAVRHYIDLDHWGDSAWYTLPRDYSRALLEHSAFYYIRQNDTHKIFQPHFGKDSFLFKDDFSAEHLCLFNGLSYAQFDQVFASRFMPEYDIDEWTVDASLLGDWIKDGKETDKIWIVDSLSPHGILPYNLEKFYYRLKEAFRRKDQDAILRLSTDLGHYIGDAHVPLHTTKNYNGQLTNQDGIHAFWESRIPELFAEAEFDLVVGQSTYIKDVESFLWDCIKDSHEGVKKVLEIEKKISIETPVDEQYCFETRLAQLTKIQCSDYAKKYHEELDYQVEERFRACILAIGSIWMSAWVDAGQPDLHHIEKSVSPVDLDTSIIPSKSIRQIRTHE